MLDLIHGILSTLLRVGGWGMLAIAITASTTGIFLLVDAVRRQEKMPTPAQWLTIFALLWIAELVIEIGVKL